MHFGMPTLIDVPSPEECCALCRSLGLDFVELNMNLPHYQPGTLDVDRLLAAAETHGVYYTLHLDENLNPCDFNPLVAKAYTETALRALDIARRLHAPVVTMHLSLGVFFTLPGRRVYLFDTYKDQYRANLRAFRDSCTAPTSPSASKTVAILAGHHSSFVGWTCCWKAPSSH